MRPSITGYCHYSAVLYRIEGGAWFELLTPWLSKAIHKDVVGATAGKEALDVAWAAQGYIEESMCKGISAVLSSYDFSKYFDSFDHDLTKQLLLHLGVPELLVNLMHNLYKDMQRIMKKGNHSVKRSRYIMGTDREMCCH